MIQFLLIAVLISFFVCSSLVTSFRESAFNSRLTGFGSDLKQRLLKPSPVQKNIQLVEIDNRTLEQFSEYGRWPWQRDPQAFLIYSLIQYNPRLLVLDIIYSEKESVRIPLELENDLLKLGHTDLVKRYSPEGKLLKILNRYKDKIVLTSGAESLGIAESESEHELPQIENPILNLAEYTAVAPHMGFSVSQPDQDGILRRIFLNFSLKNEKIPSLALKSARLSGQNFSEPSVNEVQLNFRSDVKEKHAISAADILLAEQDSEMGRKLKARIESQIKESIVVLGVTATSASDYHASAGGLVSGPELVVTALDNLLTGDYLREPSATLVLTISVLLLLFFLMIQIYKTRLSSAQIILMFFALGAVVLLTDAFAFLQSINLPSVWLYLLLLIGLFLLVYEKYQLVEEQKNFIKSAFSKYISPDYVDEILKNPEKLKIGGQRKELTIMFSDIRSFTSFSEKMDAKNLGEFLNEYLDEMTEIVFASRGTLDKYIGDAVMAFWGDPLDSFDHAHAACEAAQKMMVWVRVKKVHFKTKYDIDLEIGIGINTGLVSVGNMGSSKSLGYTVIGDAVNLSSRLEGATKNYGVSILTTESTLLQIRNSGKPLPSHRYLDDLKVKGKNEAVRIAQVFETAAPALFIESFARARELYVKQNWDAAISAFEDCSNQHLDFFGQTDPVSLMYIERCRFYKSESPASDWDGSWKLETK